MATETLRPNAAGGEENIEFVVGDGAGTHYTTVDEATSDDDTTHVACDNNITYLRDLYNVANHSVGSGVINAITVYARCKGAGTVSQVSLKIAIKSGQGTGAPDTVAESSAITVTTSYALYSNQWTTNPKTGAAWTWDEIDNLQIGVAIRGVGSSTQTRCTQVYVEVDYTVTVTEKTSSDSGSGVDAYVSLETGEAKTSSDAGSGAEGTPLPSAFLAGSETGFGIEALIFRLLATIDTGTSIEVAKVVGLLKDLFATELGWGNDSIIAKIEMPTKGGGMKLWT